MYFITPVPENLIEDGSIADLQAVLFNSRPWHCREQVRYPMHAAVWDAFKITRPIDWHAVILEWPHSSVKDAGRLAFTRNEKDGVADRQTVTSIGKYLTRHWSGLIPDHQIRAIAARYTGSGYEIWEGMDSMIHAVNAGPKSCMSDLNMDRLGQHPYNVYYGGYGWKVAVKLVDGEIVSRALLCEDKRARRFVRTYKKIPGNTGYSQRDEEMEEWLIQKGWFHDHGWGGSLVAKLTTPRGKVLMPYLDGDCQYVDDMGDHFVITDTGDYECTNADGTANEAGRECECCGSTCSDDEGIYVGYDQDMFVGECCAEDYVYCYGRRGDQYYEHYENVLSCGHDNYHDEYLDDNNMVRLGDGDLCHTDDASYCEMDEEWYHSADCVFAEDRQESVHRDNAWRCADSGDWYSTDEAFVEVDGDKYHPDNNVPEQQEEAA